MRASMVAIIHAFVMRDRSPNRLTAAPAMDEWNVIAKYPTSELAPLQSARTSFRASNLRH